MTLSASMATGSLATTDGSYVPIDKQEPILRADSREISLLVADENLSLTYASRAAGERVTDPHVHQHTEAFYVLEGALTFQVGAPPGVAHSFYTAGDQPARWLIIHARDGGFAAFMRGIRDGARIDWDIAPVPPDGGLPADHAIVSRTPVDR
jgi:cupin domain